MKSEEYGFTIFRFYFRFFFKYFLEPFISTLYICLFISLLKIRYSFLIDAFSFFFSFQVMFKFYTPTFFPSFFICLIYFLGEFKILRFFISLLTFLPKLFFFFSLALPFFWHLFECSILLIFQIFSYSSYFNKSNMSTSTCLETSYLVG